MQQISPAQLLASLPELERAKYLNGLTTQQKADLKWHWPFKARHNQLAPEGEWRTWLAKAGRSFGKTEAGAQWIRQRVESGSMAIALIAETQKDLEEVMVPRILKVSPPWNMPSVRYRPVRMVWPSGAEALGYNGTEPNQLRGPEFDTAWCDELAKYRRARELWDMLQFTMRSGEDPRVFVSTTPRPIKLIREIEANKKTVVTRGTTMDNADNLPPSFVEGILEQYDGTRLGRQEIYGETLDDFPGALWTREIIDEMRVDAAPEMQRVIVSVDPSGTKGDGRGDDIGIIVAGLGVDGRGYILADRTCQMAPVDWARRVVHAYHEFKADKIVAEGNFGAALVTSNIQSVDKFVPIKIVTASRGKIVRAEPVASLYGQGRVSHVGSHDLLEDQYLAMTPSGYQGEGSPDRADAAIWAITELMLTGRGSLLDML